MACLINRSSMAPTKAEKKKEEAEALAKKKKEAEEALAKKKKDEEEALATQKKAENVDDEPIGNAASSFPENCVSSSPKSRRSSA